MLAISSSLYIEYGIESDSFHYFSPFLKYCDTVTGDFMPMDTAPGKKGI